MVAEVAMENGACAGVGDFVFPGDAGAQNP